MFDSVIANWVLAGLCLSLLELIVPGVFLIWFGLAAFLMSIVAYFAPLMPVTTQLIWFALFSAVFALCGFFCYRYIFKKIKEPAEYKNLNDTAEQLVGKLVTLAEDCVDNQTKVKVGDSFWLAYCEKQLKKGDRAKIVGVKDSLILIIE